MTTLIADLTKCQSYANCVVAAPDLLDIDEEGLVVVLRSDISEADLAKAREAVDSCPVAALRLEN